MAHGMEENEFLILVEGKRKNIEEKIEHSGIAIFTISCKLHSAYKRTNTWVYVKWF